MKKLMLISFLLILSSSVSAGNVYKWVDKDGVVNFTDDSERVPPAYRGRVQVETANDALKVEPPTAVQPTPPKRDETWWREKVLLWEKRLDEATSNYETARKDLLKRGEWLVQRRYGSKTQYQMISVELNDTSQRLKELREQIVEAQRMLDKLSKESGVIESVREQALFSGQKEKIRTDLYGRDETWWKEKIRPWKEQLKAATENYEVARQALVKQEEGLGPFKWGRLSLTQYQMISSRTVELSGQMAKYEAQIVEAEGMLEKLSRDAQETRADPAWLE